MKLDKLNLDGKKSSIEVLDKIFSAKINHKLVSSVLYKTNANYKGRHAKTKQQNEVSGPTSKIYAQKGTGNARHASKKAPIFVGGGIAHGPKGQLANCPLGPCAIPPPTNIGAFLLACLALPVPF